MDYKIIRKKDLKTKNWSGGISTELFIYPENTSVDSDFLFRISTATINPGTYPFTPFKDYQRFLFLLDGEVKLNLNHQEIFLTKNSNIHFSGNDQIFSSSNIICTDFNLIYKDNIHIFDFKFTENSISGNEMPLGDITIYYNIEKEKHIRVNSNEYLLNKGDVLVCCGNNFFIEEKGAGILLSLNIK